jgi:CheY-like chemotaxis protein/anti-sigma regulatory factor (Ser/Thr protein kinase)
MLEEMLRNLLSNAVRYTDAGKILLGCRRRGDNVHIEVWDSGVGITQAQLPHIFAEYYQGAEGIQRGGFGLGLAIVRRLATLLNHRVDVRSAPGKGTRFSIEVPRAKTIGNLQEQPLGSMNGVEFWARNVLVIEDETSVRSAVVRFLKAKGVGALVAATGDEALALINQQHVHPDLVLSDYNLRGSSNGVEGIKALRTALGWDVPAIVMTGDTRSESIEAIGAQDILVLIKPFSMDELLHHMSRLHRSQQSPQWSMGRSRTPS